MAANLKKIVNRNKLLNINIFYEIAERLARNKNQTTAKHKTVNTYALKIAENTINCTIMTFNKI